MFTIKKKIKGLTFKLCIHLQSCRFIQFNLFFILPVHNNSHLKALWQYNNEADWCTRTNTGAFHWPLHCSYMSTHFFDFCLHIHFVCPAHSFINETSGFFLPGAVNASLVWTPLMKLRFLIKLLLSLFINLSWSGSVTHFILFIVNDCIFDQF